MTSSDPALSVRLAGDLGAFTLDVAFNAPMRGVTALFGPSGCGKTTILRCMAGLERLDGTLRVGSQLWQDGATGRFLPPHQRPVGYVFQEASLFPHLDVAANLLYGARRAGAAKPIDGLDLQSVAALLGITHLLDRSPLTLSGGERQRVAVGRALLSAPSLLLMDEPLSALDRMTKEEIIPYLELLHERVALPIVYVSHDFTEIERLADTVVLMDKGRVTATGPLSELQTDRRFPLLGTREASVALPGRIRAFDPEFGLTRLEIGGGEVWVPGRHGNPGDVRRLRIAAADVSLARTAAPDTTILNCLPARIETILARPGEPQATVILSLGEAGNGAKIAARITRRSLASLALETGQTVVAQIKSVALMATGAATPDGD